MRRGEMFMFMHQRSCLTFTYAKASFWTVNGVSLHLNSIIKKNSKLCLGVAAICTHLECEIKLIPTKMFYKCVILKKSTIFFYVHPCPGQGVISVLMLLDQEKATRWMDGVHASSPSMHILQVCTFGPESWYSFLLLAKIPSTTYLRSVLLSSHSLTAAIVTNTYQQDTFETLLLIHPFLICVENSIQTSPSTSCEI